MEYLASLKNIESLVRAECEKPSLDVRALAERIQQLAPSSTDLASDVEIALRTCLAGLMCQIDPKVPVSETSPVIRLIKFSIDYALMVNDLASGLPKVPFLLIEDLLESQTIQQAKEIWTIVEGWTDQLTNDNLFSKGKFTMLKTCNSLLRKLSKSCDTEFCGRILLFLAAIYPISERSAVNLMGKVNVNNVTYYEDQEAFHANLGSVETKKDMTGGEDGEEVEGKSLVVTYPLYSKFWKLQSFFASESKSFDDPKDYWADFMAHARHAIDTLVRAASADQEEEQQEEDRDSHHSSSLPFSRDRRGAANSSEEGSGCKFLTSSQLFSLQCRDPLLRHQVSVQLLFFAHYFRVKALPLFSEGDKKLEYSKDISYLESSARQLIHSPPRTSHSEDLVQIVQRILEREDHWIRWKAASCQPFERITDIGHKRKHSDDGDQEVTMMMMGTYTPPGIRWSNGRQYMFDCSADSVQDVAQRLAACIPPFEEQIQLYLDAEDPEAGIEDEYHPKHDQLYCWRTRRLLAEEGVDVFKVMLDGNLGRGLRKMKNLPEPVVVQRAADMDVDMDEENEEGEGEEKTSMDLEGVATESNADSNTENGREGGEGGTTDNTEAASASSPTESETSATMEA